MAAIDLLRAPEGATSAELRRLGVKGAGLGAVLFAPGLLWYLFASDWAFATFGVQVGDKLYLPSVVVLAVGGPMTAGYALLMIGLARMLFGASWHSKAPLASLGRILFGLIATIGLVIVVIKIFLMTSRGG
ncbi:Hypothetical protein A7982_01682 [Minicystis rosea]|nr:Hypothetical protein A7982_01682 [Minicystis rosea]